MFTLFMSLSMIMLQIDFVMGILIHFNFLLQLFERPLIFLDFCVFKEAVCFSGKKKSTSKVYSMPSFKIHNTSLVSFSTLLKGF